MSMNLSFFLSFTSYSWIIIAFKMRSVLSYLQLTCVDILLIQTLALPSLLQIICIEGKRKSCSFFVQREMIAANKRRQSSVRILCREKTLHSLQSDLHLSTRTSFFFLLVPQEDRERERERHFKSLLLDPMQYIYILPVKDGINKGIL